ncbi:Uncharacterised protein [Mycobacteroides abscessus subsp. abscessus]|nr:Uncharacterised protein [Mycobacteroides abscessus subsp. abscessus]
MAVLTISRSLSRTRGADPGANCSRVMVFDRTISSELEVKRSA